MKLHIYSICGRSLTSDFYFFVSVACLNGIFFREVVTDLTLGRDHTNALFVIPVLQRELI